MNTPERWSTASSDSDLSSIFGAGNVFENSQTPVVKSFVVCVATVNVSAQKLRTVGYLSHLLKFTFKEMADGKDWELRILLTYFKIKLRFCTVSRLIVGSFYVHWSPESLSNYHSCVLNDMKQ